MTLFKNSLLFLVSTGVAKGTPFLLLPLFARFLSVEDFGYYTLAITILGVLSLVFAFNPSLFIIANYHKIKIDDWGLYIFQITILALACALFTALFFFYYEDLSKRYGMPLAVVYVIIMTAIGRVLLNIGLVVLQMSKRAYDYLKVTLGFAIPLIAFTSFALAFYQANWISILLIEAILTSIAGLLTIFWLHKHKLFSVGISKKKFLRILNFSLPLFPHVLAFWALNAMDRFFLVEMKDVETVGLYSAAYTIGLGLSLVHEAAHKAWQPYFFEFLSEGSYQKKRFMIRLTWYYYLASLLFCVFYIVLAMVLVPPLLGESYANAESYIPAICIGYTFFGMYRVIAGYLYFDNKTYLLAAISVSAAIVNAILNYYFVPLYGGAGAAYSTLASFAYLFFVVKTLIIIRSDVKWLTFQ